MLLINRLKTKNTDITQEELDMMDESMQNFKEGNLPDPVKLDFDDSEDEGLYALAIERMKNYDPTKCIPQPEVDKLFGFDSDPSDDENIEIG